MNDMLQGKRFLGAVGMSVLLALVLCGTALGQQPAPGQQIDVSGRVTAPDGERIRGASVRIRGTTTSAITDDEGKYSLTAPSDAVLVFNRIGYRGVGVSVGGHSGRRCVHRLASSSRACAVASCPRCGSTWDQPARDPR